MAAMQAGKHVFCQKPLCHDVHEARELTKAAKKYGAEKIYMDHRELLAV